MSISWCRRDDAIRILPRAAGNPEIDRLNRHWRRKRRTRWLRRLLSGVR
jgi:hypothetical protein